MYSIIFFVCFDVVFLKENINARDQNQNNKGSNLFLHRWFFQVQKGHTHLNRLKRDFV